MVFDHKINSTTGIIHGLEAKISVHYEKNKPYIGYRVRYPTDEKSSRIGMMNMSYNVCENLYRVFKTNVFTHCMLDRWMQNISIVTTSDTILMLGIAPNYIDRQGIFQSYHYLGGTQCKPITHPKA